MTGRSVRVLVALLGVVGVGVGLWGLVVDGAAPTPSARGVTAPAATSPPVPAVPATAARRTSAASLAAPLVGLAVRIDRLGVTSSLVPLGLNPDRTVAVPPLEAPEQAGWYENGPLPGDVGPAVLLGHVNGNGRAGVFSRLADLRPGDPVTVQRDGRLLTFRVDRVEQVAKSAFPTARVYGDTAGPELRLITCGGTLDRTAHRYLGQVIVFARLAA